MFDIGAAEVLLIAIVAVVVIGPKDLPLAMRTAGRWIGKLRKVSSHFRSGLDAIVREAELEDMEKKWKAQNEKIMRDHPEGVPPEMERTGAWPATQRPDLAPPPSEEREQQKRAGEADAEASGESTKPVASDKSAAPHADDGQPPHNDARES